MGLYSEAFEQLNNLEDAERAVLSLKYMLMCKIMSSNAEDVPSLISSKAGPPPEAYTRPLFGST